MKVFRSFVRFWMINFGLLLILFTLSLKIVDAINIQTSGTIIVEESFASSNSREPTVPQSYSLDSLGGILSLYVETVKDGVYYKLDNIVDKFPIVGLSKLCLNVKKQLKLEGVRISGLQAAKVEDDWDMVWGTQKTVENRYRQLILDFSTGISTEVVAISIEFRLYDDGLGFRYLVSTSSKTAVHVDLEIEEKTEFDLFDPRADTWAAASWKKLKSRYDLKHTRGGNTARGADTPIVVGRTSPEYWVALHEAGLLDDVAVSTDADKSVVEFTTSRLINLDGVWATSFRTIGFARTEKGLLQSNLILNLNDRSQIINSEWIIPGKALWDKHINGITEGEGGFIYQSENIQSAFRLVDFASAYGIEYVLLSESWYKNDPKQPRYIDISRIVEYGKTKSNRVGIWLEVHHETLATYSLDDTFKTYQQWGVAGVKHTSAMDSTLENFVLQHVILEKCAEYQLMYMSDQPVKPTGLRRKYPHYMANQYVSRQLEESEPYPTDIVTLPFVHGLVGNTERNSGLFGIESKKRIRSTVVAQVAQGFIFYSGFQILPDTPEQYYYKLDLFEFIASLPSSWDDFGVIDAQIGQYMTVMRERAGRFYVCSLADEGGRRFTLKMDFLKEDKYQMRMYMDTDASSYRSDGNRESYIIREVVEVNKNSKINVEIGEGGGFCAQIIPTHENFNDLSKGDFAVATSEMPTPFPSTLFPTPFPSPVPKTERPTAFPSPYPTPAPTTQFPTSQPTHFPTTSEPTAYTPPTPAPDARTLPNIIFILADDMGVGDTSVEGYRIEDNPNQIQTPNLEKMARNGIKFTNAYANSPVCGPTRYAFLVGRHTGKTLIRGNTGKKSGGENSDYALPPGEMTVAEILLQRGYYTYIIGKWGFGGHDARPPSHPLDRGFIKFYGQLTHEEAHINMPTELWNNDINDDLDDRYTQNFKLPKNEDASDAKCVSDPKSCDFVHDKYTEAALTFIEDRAKNVRNEPYFLYLSYSSPHVGSWMPQKRVRSWSDEVRKVAPVYSCDDSFQVEDNVYREEECRHRGLIENYLDKDIGKILKLVDEMGVAEKTLIVFAADNGPNGNIFVRRKKIHSLSTFKSTADMRGGKREVFEGGIRTPLLMQWKGTIQAGTIENLPTSTEDLFATFVDVGRAKHLLRPPENNVPLDGVSLFPIMVGETSSQIKREYLYFEYCKLQALNWGAIRKNPDSYCSWALRRKDGWKLVFEDKSQSYYLFDLNNDPGEENNLYKFQSEIVEDLEKMKQDAHVPLQDLGYSGQTLSW